MNINTPAGHFSNPFSPDYVLDNFVDPNCGVKERETIMNVDGVEYPVYLNSQRYLLFKRDGLKCARCERVASVCYLAMPNKNATSKRSHFNFFSVDANGKFILFTKDHKVSRANGGRDVMDNYVPMCQICNTKKGSKGTKEEINAAIKNGTAIDLSASYKFDVKIPVKIQQNDVAMDNINKSVLMMDATITRVSDSESVFTVVATRNPKFVHRTLKDLITLMHNIISCKPNAHSTVK